MPSAKRYTKRPERPRTFRPSSSSAADRCCWRFRPATRPTTTTSWDSSLGTPWETPAWRFIASTQTRSAAAATACTRTRRSSISTACPTRNTTAAREPSGTGAGSSGPATRRSPWRSTPRSTAKKPRQCASSSWGFFRSRTGMSLTRPERTSARGTSRTTTTCSERTRIRMPNPANHRRAARRKRTRRKLPALALPPSPE
mmetsp:Transcript_12090/g.34633  ORF Transcript_12090/g.34633 Transcript_12090/m.34633 type:complete len:200 (-) Transcript_12090:1532-2131(-)